MRKTWRWFGPQDIVTLDEIRQAGVEGVVSALHDIPNGEVWIAEDIKTRQQIISGNSSGTHASLAWEVVESLPVSESIKKQDGDWRRHIEAYKTSLSNLADAGLKVVCYNFMPVLDWTRTDLHWRLSHGGTCMRFDVIDFVMFDIHVLKRKNAERDYAESIRLQAEQRIVGKSDDELQRLLSAIVCGLPGANQQLTPDSVLELLDQYSGIDAGILRRHHHDFLEMVAPHAQKIGVRLCCHPDDPPFPLLGLPRVVSTEADYDAMLKAVDVPANGITLCSGSLGVRADNDLPGMMERLGARVHFLHLRNVKRETDILPCSFHEAEHLGGDTDMVALISAVLKEENHRAQSGRSDHTIPMRPDHGQCVLDDLKRPSQPGYPAIGRLKGLAELRGIERALSHHSVQF